MIIKLYSNRKVEPSSIIMANQHENMTRVLEFNLEQVPNGYRYLVLTNSSGSNLYLITDNKVDITSAFTWNGQTYEANVVVSNIELENELVSTNVLWISNTFRLQVRRNNINAEELSKLPIPPDLQMPYDKLLQLIEDVEGKLENGEFNGEDGVGIKSIEKTKSEGLVDTYTITLTDDSTFVYSVTNGRDGIDGKSAYELAVENGYQGTEEEWLESLRYDHSEEFKQLSEQVKQDAKSAEDSATKAESAMNEANTTAQANVKAINKASTNAVQAVQDAQSTAEESIGDKQTEAVQAVDTAKTSATTEITEQKENALTEITNEKNSATEAIETGKTEALTEIETAKDEAIEEIENTGVPLEDIEKLAIKETTQGNPTIISDSAEWRFQDLKVYGQSEQGNTTGSQLFDILKATPRTNVFGLTVTINGDYILINGSVENLNRKDFCIINTDVSFEGKICKAFDVTTTNCSIVNLVPSVGESNIVIHLNVTALENISCKFKLMVSDTEPTSYEPYTGGKPSPSPDYPQGIISKEVSEIKVTGKNLANIQEFEAIGISGFEAQYEDDKIVYSGANNWAGCAVVLPQTFEAGQYTIKAKNVVMLVSDIQIVGFDDAEYWENLGYPYWMTNFYSKTEGYTFYSDKPFKIGFIGGAKTDGTTDAEGTMEQIQIELSSEATSYEQYKSQTITLTEPITEPITLRGVPVASDGNVIIDGQQYISDVICEKDGVIGVERNLNELLVSSLGNDKLTQGAHTNGQNYLSCNVGNAKRPIKPMSNRYIGNTYTMKNNYVYVPSTFGFIITDSRFTDKETAISIITEEQTKVVYVLNEPTFEPLPEEIQAQYKVLKSYYPNTVIQSGAFNEVTYVADTKTWIENKINGVTELALGIGR